MGPAPRGWPSSRTDCDHARPGVRRGGDLDCRHRDLGRAPSIGGIEPSPGPQRLSCRVVGVRPREDCGAGTVAGWKRGGVGLASLPPAGPRVMPGERALLAWRSRLMILALVVGRSAPRLRRPSGRRRRRPAPHRAPRRRSGASLGRARGSALRRLCVAQIPSARKGPGLSFGNPRMRRTCCG